MRSVVLMMAMALAACSRTHGRVPGLDPNRPVIDMSEAEWKAFCEWREGLRGDEPLEYHCVYPGREPVDACDMPGMTPCLDWRASACMGRGVSTVVRPLYPATRTDCSATVDELAACWEERATLACYYHLPGEGPACDVMRARCPPEG